TRGVHLMISRRGQPSTFVTVPPSWYSRWRRFVLWGSVGAIIALHAVNVFSAFYQIGVQAKVVLPFHLNVPVSWLLSTGFGLWVAVLVGWEFSIAPSTLGRLLLLPLGEALAGISTLSRGVYLLRGLAYAAVAAEHRLRISSVLGVRWRLFLLTAGVAGFAISLGGVSLLRIAT